MKNTTKSLIAGLVMLGSLGVSTAAAFASGTSQSGVSLTNPDPNWYSQHPLKLPPTSQWGRIEGRLVALNPAYQKDVSKDVLIAVSGLMQWMPLPFALGSFTKPKEAYYWGWYSTWRTPQFPTISPSGYFSFPVPPGRYSLRFAGNFDFVGSTFYNGLSNGGSNPMLSAYASPSGSPVPTNPPMFAVKPRQTVRLVTTRIASTQIWSYHAAIRGARSQLDLFGFGFDPSSVVTTDAPGVTFTKAIFTGYMGSWSDQRIRATLVMGPGTQAGTYLLDVKSLLGTAATTMTIYKAPGSKVFSARFGVNFNYAQK